MGVYRACAVRPVSIVCILIVALLAIFSGAIRGVDSYLE